MSSSSSQSPVPARVRLVEPVSPAELQLGTPILVAAFADGQQFLEAFAGERGPAGELAVPTRASPPPGTHVVLEIAWHGLPNRVFARARVQRRWFGGQLVLRLDADEAPKRDFLVRVARGTPGKIYLRRNRRFCVRLPLQWRTFGETVMRPGVAEDLSAGGLLIVGTPPLPALGQKVAVRLHADAAAQEFVLTGHVRHGRVRPPDEAAFGIQLAYRSSGEQRTLRSLLRAFAAKGVVLVDPAADAR